jgi:hypothetical protein
VKCSQYWPDKDKPLDIGEFVIELKETQENKDFVERVLVISKIGRRELPLSPKKGDDEKPEPPRSVPENAEKVGWGCFDILICFYVLLNFFCSLKSNKIENNLSCSIYCMA